MNPNCFHYFRSLGIIAFMVATGMQTATAQSQTDYYTTPAIFLPCPTFNGKAAWNIKNLGPVGIGIDLKSPGFTMVVSNSGQA